MTIECSSRMERSYQRRQDSGNILGGGTEKVQALRIGAGWSEMLSSRQDMAPAPIISQQLWSPTQEQVSQHFSMDGEGLTRPRPLLRSSWQLGCWKEGCPFSSGMWSAVGRPCGGWLHNNAHTGSVDSVFCFFLKRGQEDGKGMCWRDGRETGGGG